MKKIVFLLLIFLSACKDKESPLIPVLEIEMTSAILPATKSNTVIAIETNITDWTATVAETGSTWCTVTTQTSESGNNLYVYATANEDFDERSTEITVIAADLQRKISVRQIGIKPTIVTDRTTFNAPSAKNTISIQVVANVEFDTLVSEIWLRPIASKTKASQTYKVEFELESNLSKEERFSDIIFKQKDGDVTCVVKVTQAARSSGYTPGDVSGFENDIEIPVKRGEASEAQSGEGIELSFDGKMDTWYHSRWGTGTKFPVTLTYYFENVEKMDYLVYYPRTSGSNGRIKELEVLVLTSASPGFQSIRRYDFKGSGSPSVLTFSESLENPQAVQIKVYSGTGDGVGDYVSCAEMKFFKKNPDNSAQNIFSDDAYSELQPNVTEEMIDKMDNEFLKNIAISLFRNEYPKEFRIQSFRAFPHPETKAAENKTSTYSLLDNPTGIIAKADKEFVVFVGDTYGQYISLRVIDFKNGFGGADYILMPGINKLNITGSGLAYIMYHTDNLIAQPVKIHIPSGEINGYFDITKHTIADWTRLLNLAKENHFDVVGKYAHLVFPRLDLKQYTPNGARLIEVYDSIAWLEQRHLGLYKYQCENKNRVFFHVVYDDSYMYATSYRTAYHQSTMAELCNAKKLRTTAIWGPAHEVGHINQTRPGFKWIGMTEVSNNVSSQYVQTIFGNTSRLQAEDRYEAAFSGIISPHAIHGTYGEVFHKLVPFWQLELYFAKAKEYTDFYADVYQTIRTTSDPVDHGKAQLDFIKICCDVAKADLTGFFEAWGMLSPVDEIIKDYGDELLKITQEQIVEIKEYAQEYPVPDHKIQYIRDDNVDLYRSNAIIEQGSVSKSGSTLTLSNWSNVVACEVYDDNDNLVLATSKKTFTVPTGGRKVYAVGASGKIQVEY